MEFRELTLTGQPDDTVEPERATELGQTSEGAAEEQTAPGAEVQGRSRVEQAAERTTVKREHASEPVRVGGDGDVEERLATLSAQVREEVGRQLEAALRETRAAWEAEAALGRDAELRKSDLLRELRLFARMCEESEQARAAHASARCAEARQERVAELARVEGRAGDQLRAQLAQARLEAAERRETAVREARAAWEVEAAEARTAEAATLRLEIEQVRAAAAEGREAALREARAAWETEAAEVRAAEVAAVRA